MDNIFSGNWNVNIDTNTLENKIGKLDDLNKSEIHRIKDEDKEKIVNASRHSDDNNTSVNHSFNSELYMKNNKNFILKNSLIKKEEVSPIFKIICPSL